LSVEYAQKAVDSLGTLIAMTGKDGVVVAIDKLVPSKMTLPNANPRVSSPDKSIGLAIAGLYTDGRALHNYAVEVSMAFLKDYRYPISINKLADRVSIWFDVFVCFFRFLIICTTSRWVSVVRLAVQSFSAHGTNQYVSFILRPYS
jgi:20S proteasome subunit alpha 7